MVFISFIPYCGFRIQSENRLRSCLIENSLYADRQIFLLRLIRKFRNKAGVIHCQLCSANLCIIQRKQSSEKLTCQAASNHALNHLNKPLYHCKRCLATVTNLSAMRKHVRTKYNLSSAGEYVDRSDDFHSEILDVLSKCYDKADH